MTAYDYDKQQWVEGKAGARLTIDQADQEIALIKKNPEYLTFIGVTDQQDYMIRIKNTQRLALEELA